MRDHTYRELTIREEIEEKLLKKIHKIVPRTAPDNYQKFRQELFKNIESLIYKPKK